MPKGCANVFTVPTAFLQMIEWFPVPKREGSFSKTRAETAEIEIVTG